MAKVTGALCSVTASGSLKNTLTYSKFKQTQTVKGIRLEKVSPYHLRNKPVHSQTLKQLSVRDRFRTLIGQWNNLSANDKQVYKNIVSALPITAIGYYIKENFKKTYDFDSYKNFYLWGIGQRINLFLFGENSPTALLLSTVRGK